jgi:hypothetical protein
METEGLVEAKGLLQPLLLEPVAQGGCEAGMPGYRYTLCLGHSAQ